MEQLTPELEKKVIELVKQNRLLDAVALVKKETTLGLKESKDLVDKYKLLHH